MCKGQSDYSLGRGSDDQKGNPQSQKGRQGTESHVYVGVVSSGSGDWGAQFCVAQGSYGGHEAR